MSNLLLIGDFNGAATFCSDAKPILQLVGWVVTIIKIVVPLIIIVLGLIDLGRAAISSKPEEVKKAGTSLMWRLVGGAAIFFIPTLVMLAFGFVNDFQDAKAQVKDYGVCQDCINKPWNCK